MTTRSGTNYQSDRVRTRNQKEMSTDSGQAQTQGTGDEPPAVSAEMLVAMLQEQQRALLQQQEMQREQQRSQQALMEKLLEQQREEMEKCKREVQELKEKDVASGDAKTKLPRPTFQKLGEHDDIENFLAMFERIAEQQKWPGDVWATQWAGLLTGKAMAAYAALQAGEAGDYKVVKKTILHRYNVNEETHRLRFRQDRKKHDESYREWVCREADHFDRWTKDQEMSLRDMVVMEQVLQNVPAELAVWLKERKPSSLAECKIRLQIWSVNNIILVGHLYSLVPTSPNFEWPL